MKRSLIPMLAALVIAAAFGCKKDNKIPEPTTGPLTGTKSELVKDSIFYLAKETYFWSDNLPAYSVFKPRGYSGSNDIDAFNAEVLGIAQYSTNKYDVLNGDTKYSFVDGGGTASSIGGTGSSFGFSIIFNAVDDIRVRYVYPGSPAGTAGLLRGYQIVGMNGRTGTSLNYDATQSGAYGPNLTAITTFLARTPLNMTLKKPDGSTFDVTLNATNYTLQPLVKQAVLDAGNGKKVGYISYISFTTPDNSQAALDKAFTDFAAAGVTDLVVDLRYNGGGSVATAEHLSNLIAPSSKNNTLMYKTIWAKPMQEGNAPYLVKKLKEMPGIDQTLSQFAPNHPYTSTKFEKKGSLNISGKVYFFVSGSTASASELVINNSLPTGNVQLVGRTSYGKPVGFFAVPFYTAPSTKYDVYLAQFETKNAANQGEYFTGMTPASASYPGKLMERDDVTHDFGDPAEAWLAQVLSNVRTGQYSVAIDSRLMSAGKKSMSKSDVAALEPGNLSIEEKLHPFNGMVWDRKK